MCSLLSVSLYVCVHESLTHANSEGDPIAAPSICWKHSESKIKDDLIVANSINISGLLLLTETSKPFMAVIVLYLRKLYSNISNVLIQF